MASKPSFGNGDSDSDDDFVIIGTPVPQLDESEPLKKPISVQDLTARDKEGRRRFHGAFTGGFSAGYFNTVGTKEGFTPSTFVSSHSSKNERTGFRPEDFMDDEDLEEHGIAPEKFVTRSSYTSEERKRRREIDLTLGHKSSALDLSSAIVDLISPEQLPIGMKLLRKMGWKEGQGIGPRVNRRKKKASTRSSQKGVKTYGCNLPSSDNDDSNPDNFVPESMSEVTFAPRDVTTMPLDVKDNVHGLGYCGLNPSLALPGSHTNLFSSTPVQSRFGSKGIRGQAFGVGAFEDEDADIYSVDNMSNYDITMGDSDKQDNNFGWTAPRHHGKQNVPVNYVGKLLEGFCLSSKPIPNKKKFAAPELPRNFRPIHWFRKHRAISHIQDQQSWDNNTASTSRNMTAVDRGLLLGESPVMSSVFDLVSPEDRLRIAATKTVNKVDTSAQLTSPETQQKQIQEEAERLKANLLSSKFKPAGMTSLTPSDLVLGQGSGTSQSAEQLPLFSGSMSIQPFKKDPAKQERYSRYLALVKQSHSDPYSAVANPIMTEWEKSRERDEFSKSSKIFRPMSALMSTRFVTSAMIDDQEEINLHTAQSDEKSDQMTASEMKMFGKLTRTEAEWHPEKLLCRRFNVPNPYPGSDVIGIPSVKRDKFSVFNFLSIGDYQPKDSREHAVPEKDKEKKTDDFSMGMSKAHPKKTLASVFEVLNDPNFHKPGVFSHSGNKAENETPDKTNDLGMKASSEDKEKSDEKDKEKSDEEDKEKSDEEDKEKSDEEDKEPTLDLFRAIFKNSDSEDDDSDEDIEEEIEKKLADDENERSKSLPGQQEIAVSSNDNVGDRQVQPSNPPCSISESKSDACSFRVPPPLVNTQGPLDVGEEEESYGPQLPPSLFPITTDDSSVRDISSSVSERNHLGTSSHNIEKLKNKDHKHKEKKKKSKHKKDKKRKHKQSKKSSLSHKRQTDESIGSEEDTESSVSDEELLHRLKKASKNGVSRKYLSKMSPIT